MKESKSVKHRRLASRERRRIETIKKKHGADWFHRNAKKAGKLTPTKFSSETGRAAALKRHAETRARRGKGAVNGSNDSKPKT